MKAFPMQPLLYKKSVVHLFLSRKFMGYILLFVLIAISASSLSITRFTQEQPVLRLLQVLQLSIFILMGSIHAILLEKRPNFNHHSMRDKFYFSLILTLIIFGVLLSYFFIIPTSSKSIVLTSCCAFLLPSLLVQACHYYLEISQNATMIWRDSTPAVGEADIVYLNTILVQLRFSSNSLVKHKKSFLVNMPLNKEFGRLFNLFWNIEKNRNKADYELIKQDDPLYGWIFFVVSFGGLFKKILDPTKSLQNNKAIKRNRTILVKRIKLQ